MAVKVFRLDITPEQSQALADELSRAADAGLFHPSIVEPLAAGVEGTVAYRAEEYVAAESLDVAMRHYAPAALDKALPFLTQLAGAIDFARTAGIGHGALHLRDVFVTPDEARASGFGVVEALERVGLRAPVRRPYSAPERIAGEAWSTPADVFSLGAIAYELLTGRRPSGTGDEIGALTGENVGVHAQSIRGVLARAMHDEPAGRYPSALAFASALEAAARGRHVTTSVAVSRRRQRRRAGARRQPAATPAAPIEAVAEPPAEDAADILAERDEDAAHTICCEEEIDGRADALRRRGGGRPGAGPAGHVARFRPRRDRSVVGRGPVGCVLAGRARRRQRAERRRIRRAAVLSVTSRPGASASTDEEAHGAVILERPRPAMLPMALTLLLGLLLGFAAGYAVGGRASVAGRSNGRRRRRRPSPAPPPAPPPQQSAGSAQPQRSGRAYSEQVVAQPSGAPPPVPGDAPPLHAAPRRPAGQMIVSSIRRAPASRSTATGADERR